jgi:hypothetical protein
MNPNGSTGYPVQFYPFFQRVSLQGIHQFAAIFSPKFVLLKFRKSQGKFAANLQQTTFWFIAKFGHDFGATFLRVCRVFAATFPGILPRNFTAYLSRIYCIFTVYLPCIYYVFITYLLCIYHVFSYIFLHICRIFDAYLSHI